jgi:hypothetical protein
MKLETTDITQLRLSACDREDLLLLPQIRGFSRLLGQGLNDKSPGVERFWKEKNS